MKRVRASLRSRLTWLSISVMVAVLVPVGVLTYWRQTLQIDLLLDSRLAQTAHTVGALIVRGATFPLLVNRGPSSPFPAGSVVSPTGDLATDIGYQACDSTGAPILVTRDLVDLAQPTLADLGFRTVVFKGEPWRFFTLHGHSGSIVRVGERFDTREALSHALVMEYLLPLLLGVPLLALLLGVAVKGGLRPLQRLTALLHQRAAGSRQRVEMPEASTELRPLIDTLNQQFERLEDALEREQRFSGDVAHELRTPLAAVMLRVDSAALEPDRAVANASLLRARQGLERLSRRIDQILSLARLEASAAAGGFERCDLVALVKGVVEELAPLIIEKDVNLGFAYDEAEAPLMGHEASLGAMLRNLIENALRYVRPGGTVEVALHAEPEAWVVEVQDDGPGIPADRRAKVFERFHREGSDLPEGFGLGLSIVRRAIERHAASIELLAPEGGVGLLVRVRLPRGQQS